ncbi:MAG: endonuclease III [Methanobacteriota archaeon]|nr:MAG: endonuclease III [Euryarchaeota archaeon]
MTPEERVKAVIRLLKKEYPQIRTALRFNDPLQLLVATILSAQCTDERVNRVTEELFKKYRTAKDYATADPRVFEQVIRSTGFYRNKARNIIAAAQMIVEEYDGRVPDSMEELIRLPGVARKTANIVLSNAYGKLEGIAVDTHVKRLSRLLGLTDHTDPVKIEQDLMRITPREEWSNLSHLLIFHGRAVCMARRPKHEKCILYSLCPSREV